MSEKDYDGSEQDQNETVNALFSSTETRDTQSRGEPSSPVQEDTLSSDMPSLDSKSSNYFTALDSSIEGLQKRAQQLIDEINESRKKDHTLMNNLRDRLLMKVSELIQKLEEGIYEIYDHHNKMMQDKLQELTEIMGRIGQLEIELKQVCRTVVTVYKDLCVQPEL
ncbi:synaptonemal complex central element protein 2 [Latimeria chalumnae]|nr:PREDICTED: synaptonemal complex central element protein 2 isoform X2 [Latimeria chalumnae]|eukprot:XP_014349496.1 PREDICTED: synaptonemal complex central element protein 2 isoform X2 [Latimeria chalumnae]